MSNLQARAFCRGLLVSACLVCLMVAGAGCLTLTVATAAEPEVVLPPLRVGVTANYPPLVFKDGKNLRGLEIDFAGLLGEALGREIQFVELKWADQIPALRAKRIDIIMSGMSVTQSRAMLVSFADPYLRVGQLPMVQAKDAHRFRYPQVVVFSAIRIGVETGTTGDLFVQTNCRKAKRVTYSSAERAAAALKRGRVDMVIHDAPVVWRLAAENEADGLVALPSPLTEEDLAWAVRREDRDLLKAVNEIREEWIESGILEQRVTSWLPALP